MDSYNIPENRLKHCYSVGKVMEYVVRQRGGTELGCRQAFFLGYIHDSMYDFEDEDTDHGECAAEVCPQYGDALGRHTYLDKLDSDRWTGMLELLYFADCVVDGAGNIVGFDGRIRDVRRRHHGDGVLEGTLTMVFTLEERGWSDMEEQVLDHFCRR